MRIGIICDQLGNLQRGGAEVQLDNTIKALNQLPNVSAEIINYKTTNITQFDLIHFFKSNGEYQILADYLKVKKIPYVVSTIIFPEKYWSTVLKYRLIDLVPNRFKYLFYPAWQLFLWKNASMLFPNTDSEALFLSQTGVDSPMEVIPNGLDEEEMLLADRTSFLERFPQLEGMKFVLNVARIDRRKNQKRLVLACKELDLPVVLIGKVWDENYWNEIRNIHYEKMYYLGPIYERPVLLGAYQCCALYCLPSSMETPGISAMEAAFFNKPVVITKDGGTKYYFKEQVYYVDWKNIEGIKQGIQTMWKQTQVQTRDIMMAYTWNSIANKYKKIYECML